MRYNTKDYGNQHDQDTQGDTGAIWLQNVGFHVAVKAKFLQVGDVLVWNYGGESKVIEVIRETKAFRFFRTEYEDYKGEVKTYERKLKRDRLVAVDGDVYDRVRAESIVAQYPDGKVK